MTIQPRPDPSLPARRLSPRECRDRLLRHHKGRLAYSTGRGLRCVVVNYAVHDDEIVLRVPEFNEICQYAPGCEVCLVIDQPVGAGSEWVEVTASGVASVVDHCEHTSRERDDLDEVWPAGVTAPTLRVPIAELHARTWPSTSSASLELNRCSTPEITSALDTTRSRSSPPDSALAQTVITSTPVRQLGTSAARCLTWARLAGRCHRRVTALYPARH